MILEVPTAAKMETQESEQLNVHCVQMDTGCCADKDSDVRSKRFCLVILSFGQKFLVEKLKKPNQYHQQNRRK